MAPAPAQDVAAAVGADQQTTYRLMRALASIGVLRESDDHRFSLTDIGEYLTTDHLESMRAFARFIGYRSNWRAWEVFDESVRTGRTGYDIVFGMPLFEYLGQNAEAADVFNEAMVATNHVAALHVAEAYDFSDIEVLVDVGGGEGALLATLLEANPHMRGIVYDLPHAAQGADRLLTKRSLLDRSEFISGDFFEKVPTTDSCILKYIIHDWDDDKAADILTNCAKAIAPGGKVILVERIVPPPAQSHVSKLLDLEMLALAGGLERTVDEYEVLFERAGLMLSRVISTQGFYSIMEGVTSD